MMTLKQKMGNDRRSFTIETDGVYVDSTDLENTQKYKVNYVEIRKDEYIYRKTAHSLFSWLCASFLLNAIFLTALLTESFSLLADYGHYVFFASLLPLIILVSVYREHFQKVELKSLDADKALTFIYTKKYGESVDAFIAEIKKAQQRYFKDKYFKIDPIIPPDIQESRLLWCYDNGYINESEYRVIMEELEHRLLTNGNLGTE